MTENEKILKALALIAAELHIQNYNFLAARNGFETGFANISEILIPNMADHFRAYFDGEPFSTGSFVSVVPKVKKGR
jgi:hypothetical protein